MLLKVVLHSKAAIIVEKRGSKEDSLQIKIEKKHKNTEGIKATI
jgi:hypothetical protein